MCPVNVVSIDSVRRSLRESDELAVQIPVEALDAATRALDRQFKTFGLLRQIAGSQLTLACRYQGMTALLPAALTEASEYAKLVAEVIANAQDQRRRA
jgi:hypothetical protein